MQRQIHDFLSDGSSNIYSISHHLRDIRKSNKCQKFDYENEALGQGEKNRIYAWNVCFYTGEYFSEF